MTSRVLSLFLLTIGFGIMISVLLPIIASQFSLWFDIRSRLIDPTAVSASRPKLTILPYGPDLTQAASWFTASPQISSPSASPVSDFSLSLPSLKIDSLSVRINDTDLKTGPIHYPGTALPGAFGNSVVFGHSSLPIFYNPRNPLTIFNPLPKIKVGDDIYVTYSQTVFHYVVKNTQTVKPDNITFLAQNYSQKQLTLITCVPLGTYWRRFVATAELVN